MIARATNGVMWDNLGYERKDVCYVQDFLNYGERKMMDSLGYFDSEV